MANERTFLTIWNSIYSEALQLFLSIHALPDECKCKDADMHLEGRCPCCLDRKQPQETSIHTENCSALLNRLRADLTMLCQDFTQIATTVENTAVGVECIELRRGVFLAANDLHKIAKTVDRLQEAVAGFRRTCDLMELRGMKHRAGEMKHHFDELNVRLTAGGKSGAS